jgi:peptidoglycan/LPS O-acetylase OafA/YrhL
MSNGLFLFATAYRIVYAVLGSYITARLAPDRPMTHALAGGVVGLLLSIVGAISTWKRVELGPHWYPLALVLTALPCAWIGGRIREKQVSRPGK